MLHVQCPRYAARKQSTHVDYVRRIFGTDRHGFIENYQCDIVHIKQFDYCPACLVIAIGFVTAAVVARYNVYTRGDIKFISRANNTC